MDKIYRNHKGAKSKGFKCCHCSRWIKFLKSIGTKHRDHCPLCLWSRHVDLEKPGDRKSECKAKMKPIGLTFKKEGIDKYGNQKQGELMITHQCVGCGKISINRIAGDDNPKVILNIFGKSKSLSPKLIKQIKENDIRLLKKTEEKEILVQLFGRNF